MPEATEYPPLDSKAWQVIEDAYKEESERRGAAIKRAWDYYDGNHHKPLKVQQDGYDDNVILNYIEVLAEKLETFLIGDGLQFDAGGDTEETEADQQIADLWAANRGDILQSNLALSGVLEGHVAVRLAPQEDDIWPKIQQIKQAHFACFWNPFDMSDVIWYRLQSGARRIDYVRGFRDGETFDHTAEVWTELTYNATRTEKDVMGNDEIRWELINEVIWEFPWPPIIDWQNLPNPNWYYGRSDAASAIRLNDSINFILSNLMRIVKHHAHPKTVGTGFTKDELVPSAVGGFWTVDNPDAKIYNLEMASDAGLSRWLADVITQTLWHSGGLVDPQTMKDQVGQLTNFGLRVLFADAISKIGKKQMLYGEAFEQIIGHAFDLAGFTPPETVTIIWPDVLPEDAEAEMRVLTAEVDRGLISKETYQERRGYNPEQEANRIADEQTTGDLGTQILNSLSFNRGQ